MNLRQRQATSYRMHFDKARVLELLHAVRKPDKDYAEIAERLVPGAKDYLPSRHHELLVRDDLAFDFARREIQRQKAFVRRLVDLLPELLSYFKLEKNEIVMALIVIDDCFHDFPLVKSQPRRDRALRDAISAVERAERAIGEAVTTMATLPFGVGIDSDQFLNGYIETLGDKSVQQNFYTFLEQLRLRHDILKICVVRAKSENDYLIISDNQAKKRIVGNAYVLSWWCDGPKLVTTPGSDFSAMCSLLYEIVGGKTNESLAGAINRFARSRERCEIDEFMREKKRLLDHTDNADTDNFLDEKLTAQDEIELANTYAALLEKGAGLNERARYMIRIMVEKACKEASSALTSYGPHIPLGRRSDDVLRAAFEGIEAHEAERKRLNIKLGELRRRMRETGIDVNFED